VRVHDPLIGSSVPIQALRLRIARLAAAPLNVLVFGETGTGKELVARDLHEGSGRQGSFVALNCAAIPDALLESELFGHSQGAFTGADRARVGFFESADSGTLFLDEVGEIPGHLQSKLLRAVEYGEFNRIGETMLRHADVRLAND
jgi:transcriptional regulator with GAF, ATPase, and Fis domain